VLFVLDVHLVELVFGLIVAKGLLRSATW